MASVVIEVFLANYNVEAVITLPDCLTATELSLLRMLMQGMSVTEIARRRNRSTKTVSFQKSQIFRKLKVRNDATVRHAVEYVGRTATTCCDVHINKPKYIQMC